MFEVKTVVVGIWVVIARIMKQRAVRFNGCMFLAVHYSKYDSGGSRMD